jgi:DNA repair ATPase RecN
MIKSLTLKNFKSYSAGKFNFSKGVNGIIGLPSSGKTNIIRALRLLCFLKPSGVNYVHNRQEKTDAFVKVELFEGSVISLKKGNNSSGEYTVNEEKFRKFGNNVPEPVSDVLNMSEINFHGQLDSPFLATSKPSEISKTINQMTGANDFDAWINKTNEEIRNKKSELKNLETSLEYDSIKLDALDGLEDCGPLLNQAYKVREKRIKLEAKLDTLETINEKIEEIKEKISRSKRIIKIGPKLKKINRIEKSIDRIGKKIDQKEQVLETIKKIIEKNHIVDMTIEDYKNTVVDYSEILRKTKKCPTCLSSIKQSTIEKFLKELSLPVEYKTGKGWVKK